MRIPQPHRVATICLFFVFVVGSVLPARSHDLENGPPDAFEEKQKAGEDIERINAAFAENVELGVVAAPGGLGNGGDWQSKANVPGRVVEEIAVGQSVAQVPGRVVDPASDAEGNRKILQGQESLKDLPPDWERELDDLRTPTEVPTSSPTFIPSKVPTTSPTHAPMRFPTKCSRKAPTRAPTCRKGMRGMTGCMMMMM
jgi:hypothetical protein